MAALANTVPDECPLTARQFDVLKAAIDGQTYKQIALAMGLSASTVKSHVSDAYKRLGVETRGEAMAYMGQRGWWGDWADPPLASVNPWLPAYLEQFDKFLASGMRDSRARTGMRVALWGVRNG